MLDNFPDGNLLNSWEIKDQTSFFHKDIKHTSHTVKLTCLQVFLWTPRDLGKELQEEAEHRLGRQQGFLEWLLPPTKTSTSHLSKIS